VAKSKRTDPSVVAATRWLERDTQGPVGRSFPELARTEAEDYEPLSEHEVQAARAEELVRELEWRRDQHDKAARERADLAKEIRRLKQEIKTAKRLSKEQRARINTLETKWRRQWVKLYDGFRADNFPKSEAAALAWSQIKIHCVKPVGEDQWVCPPWESVFAQVEEGAPMPKGKRVVFTKKAKKKAKKKTAKKKGAQRSKGKKG
jgi:hypothetical protein